MEGISHIRLTLSNGLRDRTIVRSLVVLMRADGDGKGHVDTEIEPILEP
jgi:hypothetical protein